MTELLDAVDALTLPQYVKVPQDDDTKPSGVRITTVALDPLLTRLEQAIKSAMGGTTAGASLASERAIIDGDALHKFVMIATAINDSARLIDATVYKTDPARTLRAWYVSYTQRTATAESDLWHLRRLHSWANTIEKKLDPPRIRDLPWPCPVCGSDGWWDPKDPTIDPRPRPLTVEYRPEGADLIQKARGLCRACERVFGVRELAFDLEIVEQNAREEYESQVGPYLPWELADQTQWRARHTVDKDAA